MKHEIEIADLPEGWEAVAYRVGDPDDHYYDAITKSIRRLILASSVGVLIVRKKQPRRMVLEETGEIRQSCYLLKIDDGNLILPPGREYKIVEDNNKCAE